MERKFGKVLKRKEASYPATFSFLQEIRDRVIELCKRSNFKEDACYQMGLAVDEACTNIIEHAYGGESEKVIKCRFILTERAFLVQIYDKGKSFDIDRVPEPKLNASLENREEGGLGLYFIRQFFDEIVYGKQSSINEPEDSSADGNYLLLVKYRKPALT